MLNTRLRTITPDEARKLLERNTGNRLMRATWVDHLARAITEGKWMVTHQGIAISADGRLLDGQHRLQAIIQAGRAVDMLVTSGVEEDAFRWIDGGRSRTMGDRVKLVDNAHLNKAAVGIVTNYYRCALGKQSPRADEIEDAFLKFSDSFLYAAAVITRRVRLVTTLPLGAALAVFHVYSSEKAVQAAELLLAGANMSPGHPILALREAMIAQRLRAESEIYWKAISAFRAYDEDRDYPKLYAAVTDFLGNVYDRLHYAQSARSTKAARTRLIGSAKSES